MVAFLSLFSCVTAEPQCRAEIEAWTDADGDGFGQAPLGFVCELAAGQVDVPLDCDDADADRHPGAGIVYEVDVQGGKEVLTVVESCEGLDAEDCVTHEPCDGVDNDCDGQIDEDEGLKQYWMDADDDSFGGLFPSQFACNKPGPEWVANADDCDDTDGAVNPDAQEVCGRVDEDCDGYIDESDDSVDPDSYSTYFRDADGDGYGDPATTLERCRLIPGWVLNADDCNDNNASINRIDWYVDVDNDGYGDPATLLYSCTRPSDDWVRNGDDCDDTNDDYALDVSWYDDLDEDGYGGGAVLAVQCDPPIPGAVADDSDCDDIDPGIHPGVFDACLDGIDADCDTSDACGTCQQILTNDPTAPSAVYTLHLPSGDFDVVCDMGTDGGGWTLVSSSDVPPDDAAGPWHDELDDISPSNAHEWVWDGLRNVIPGNSDIRFTCKTVLTGPWAVDLSFYDIHWYDEITTGTDTDSCFNENNGAGYDTPAPARRDNISGAFLPLGDDWNAGYLEGEDTCSDAGDFAIDFDNRGIAGSIEATDWGESSSIDRCAGVGGAAWFIFVREL